MIIGKVTEVNAANRTCTVIAYGRDDDFVLRDVHIINTITQISSTPQVGDQVVVNSEGGENYLMGSMPDISANANAEREALEMLPGDMCIGTRDQGIGFFRGGLVFLLSNPATGIMATNENGGIVNILGDSMYMDSSLYHKEILTGQSGVKISEVISGQQTVIESSQDSENGEITSEIKGLHKLKIDINQETVSPLIPPIYAEVEVNFKTTTRNIKLTISQDGDIEIQNIKDLKLKVERLGVNSDFTNPLDGLVTGNTQCPYTLGPHVDCSKTIFCGEI